MANKFILVYDIDYMLGTEIETFNTLLEMQDRYNELAKDKTNNVVLACECIREFTAEKKEVVLRYELK